MHKIEFTEGQIKLVKKMYEEEGLSITAIANKFHVSYAWLSFRMSKWGIPKRRRWAKKWRLCRGECGRTLRVSKENFYSKKDYMCKKCRSKQSASQVHYYKFGITPSDYRAMLKKQEGVCAICGKSPNNKKLAIDHCHETNKVRGLLCQLCNTGLGSFLDDPVLLTNAIDYLQER